ncbi:glycosyltransferase family 4 protein [Methylosinus sp. H3A]|uniref:glycosyltransferase family 4 protein n=1 Tax=Methylosinus sp. H3A TaxID=2785786 RepID=UPI0018C305A0|nr:glycosyltransferase family 4 protein [Methylosinus sp. H3A]MBG0809451.1 glycosyltransferase family 4 protein [Methylosinus sp. H3A]
MGPRSSVEVVQVTQEFSRAGGVESVAFELAQAFARAGVRNSVVTAVVAGDGDEATEIARVAPWLSRIPTRGALRHIGRLIVVPWFTLAATSAVRRRAGAAQVISHGDCLCGDVLVVHAVNAESLAQKRKAGNWSWLLNPLHYWVALRDAWMIGGLRYRKFVAVSARVREELQFHYNVPAERVRVIYNGIDLDRFQASEAARAAIRDAFGIPRDARLLLFVGHEFDRKGLAHVIDALALLDERYWLAVVGSDNPARYRKRAAEAESRLVFCGARRDVAAFYAAADAFVFPTAYETFSLVCMEAMAAGLPVFATRVGGIEDYLRDGVNGFTIEQDARGVADKLREAFDDEAGYAALRAGARATAENFGWDSVAAKYLDLLDEMRLEKLGVAGRSRAKSFP